jgi:hypothetical protein
MQTETEVSEYYRINTVINLKKVAEFYKTKSFSKITRQDIVKYLDRLRKPESVDPLHQWVCTYELTRVVLLRFFKWLHCPNRNDVSPRNRPTPDVMLNIPQIKHCEISIYKPTDLWTEEDDMLFYKYCPSLRDRLLGELISKSDALDFKDIKWPLLEVDDYYFWNKGGPYAEGEKAAHSAIRAILRGREENMKKQSQTEGT